jgi:hypothetical protein
LEKKFEKKIKKFEVNGRDGVACAKGLDADGHPRRIQVYADGTRDFAEADLSRGAMPRAALSVAYADGPIWLRRGFPAVGVASHSCSEHSDDIHMQLWSLHIISSEEKLISRAGIFVQVILRGECHRLNHTKY